MVAHLLEPHAVIAEVVLLDEEDQMPYALATGAQTSVLPAESLLLDLVRAPLYRSIMRTTSLMDVQCAMAALPDASEEDFPGA